MPHGCCARPPARPRPAQGEPPAKRQAVEIPYGGGLPGMGSMAGLGIGGAMGGYGMAGGGMQGLSQQQQYQQQMQMQRLQQMQRMHMQGVSPPARRPRPLDGLARQWALTHTLP